MLNQSDAAHRASQELRDLEDAFGGASMGIPSRLAAGFIGACAVGPALGWLFSLGWIAAIGAFEYVRHHFLKSQISPPITPENAPRVRTILAINAALSTCLYAAGFAAAWAFGGPVGMFIGAIWLATSLNYDLVYTSAVRAIFLASVAPLLICGFAIPLLITGLSVETFSIYAMILLVTLISIGGMLDRRRTQKAIIAAETSRRAAEAAHDVKDRLLSTLSHELRTPINAIIGFAEILEEGMVEEGKSAEASDAARISGAGRRLLQAIDQILLIADADTVRRPLTPRRTPLAAFLADVAKPFETLAQKTGVQITWRCTPAHAEIDVDSEALRDCIAPLIDNACKFGGGHAIEIAASVEPQADAGLIISVTDHGAGIAAADLKRIFDPFVQVDDAKSRKADGLGMGLPVAQHFAARLGGSLKVESNIGKGSTFMLIAPAIRAAA